jgi:hypothetical protein
MRCLNHYPYRWVAYSPPYFALCLDWLGCIARLWCGGCSRYCYLGLQVDRWTALIDLLCGGCSIAWLQERNDYITLSSSTCAPLQSAAGEGTRIGAVQQEVYDAGAWCGGSGHGGQDLEWRPGLCAARGWPDLKEIPTLMLSAGMLILTRPLFSPFLLF